VLDALRDFLQRGHAPRIPLVIALRKYWPWLSGMALFPIVFLVLDYRTIPDWLLFTLFVLSALAAWWPNMAKDAPYSFWYVAIALFFATTALGVIIAVTVGWEPLS
jgi:hypothetical protein